MTERSIEPTTEPLSWNVETGQYRYSLEAFDECVQLDLEHIVTSCQKLCRKSASFRSYDQSIAPEHIKEVRHALKELMTPTLELSKLLHDTGRLPDIYMALRFHLLALVNPLEEQISRFVELLQAYQARCMSPSESDRWLRREIYGMFEKLSQCTLQLSERAQAVRKDAREQERELLSLYENYPNWTGR